MAKAHADRQALIQSLFWILDRDGDGVLSVEELFDFARVVAHIAPHIPLPPNVDSSASPVWLEVCRDLAAAHAGPADGFDRAAFGRLVTLGLGQNAGGMALSSRALADLIRYLEVPTDSSGAAPPVDVPPPVAPPAPPVEAAPLPGTLSLPLESPGPRESAAGAAAAEPPPADGEALVHPEAPDRYSVTHIVGHALRRSSNALRFSNCEFLSRENVPPENMKVFTSCTRVFFLPYKTCQNQP